MSSKMNTSLAVILQKMATKRIKELKLMRELWRLGSRLAANYENLLF